MPLPGRSSDTLRKFTLAPDQQPSLLRLSLHLLLCTLHDLPLVATKASTASRRLPLSCSTCKLFPPGLRHTSATTFLHPKVPSTQELESLLFLFPNPPVDQLDQKLPHKGPERKSLERDSSAQSFSFAPFKPP